MPYLTPKGGALGAEVGSQPHVRLCRKALGNPIAGAYR